MLDDFKRSHLYHFPAMSEQLSREGVEQVCDHVYRSCRIWLQFEEMIGTLQVEEREYDDVTLRGRLINRIEQYLRYFHDVSLNYQQHEALANIIARNMFGGEQARYFDIVNYIRWTPGTFGENTGSCWWGGYKRGKDLFINEMKRGEAVAVRLFRPATVQELNDGRVRKWYKSYVGTGRCFVIVGNPYPNIDIVMNGYGLNQEQWRELFLTTFGYSHARDIHLRLHNEIYVNRSSGMALSTEPITIDKFVSNNFGTIAPYICQNCGLKVRIPTRYTAVREKQLCLHCADKETRSIQNTVPQRSGALPVAAPVNWTVANPINDRLYNYNAGEVLVDIPNEAIQRILRGGN